LRHASPTIGNALAINYVGYTIQANHDHMMTSYLNGVLRDFGGVHAPKTGELFERTFQTPKGPVDFLAETVVEGDALILKDVGRNRDATMAARGAPRRPIRSPGRSFRHAGASDPRPGLAATRG
jgi:hypothetical protein